MVPFELFKIALGTESLDSFCCSFFYNVSFCVTMVVEANDTGRVEAGTAQTGVDSGLWAPLSTGLCRQSCGSSVLTLRAMVTKNAEVLLRHGNKNVFIFHRAVTSCPSFFLFCSCLSSFAP